MAKEEEKKESKEIVVIPPVTWTIIGNSNLRQAVERKCTSFHEDFRISVNIVKLVAAKRCKRISRRRTRKQKMETLRKLEEETKMKGKTDGIGRLKKTRQDSRVVGERGLIRKFIITLYSYIGKLRVSATARIRYPSANIILKPKFRANFCLLFPCSMPTSRRAATRTRGYFSNRTFFIQARRGRIISLFSSPWMFEQYRK